VSDGVHKFPGARRYGSVPATYQHGITLLGVLVLDRSDDVAHDPCYYRQKEKLPASFISVQYVDLDRLVGFNHSALPSLVRGNSTIAGDLTPIHGRFVRINSAPNRYRVGAAIVVVQHFSRSGTFVVRHSAAHDRKGLEQLASS
jgi:hypothetical protein